MVRMGVEITELMTEIGPWLTREERKTRLSEARNRITT